MPKIEARFILTDIEGTTTSISFVKDILFPYAKEHTKAFLESHWQNAESQALVKELCELEQYKEFLQTLPERKEATELNVAIVAAFVNYLIDRDLKLGPLKVLQGLVWEEGYTNGSIKGHVYPDVPSAFKHWQETGVRIGIYSSGSIKAQKLLFGQTELGDLLPYLSAYFDTTIGHKQQSESYKGIVKELGISAGDIVFLTDVIKEAQAARLAGMQTIILDRPGNAPLTEAEKTDFTLAHDFSELNISLPEK